jgi:uncharacterized protein YdeI (YjbR/CyaY-like superfamily)
VSEPVFFPGPEQWREWLEQHHETATECLVGFVKVTTGEASMTWSESVDQALCFGWIDGVRRRIDERSYSIRFTPRKPGSTWSAVNVAKVEQLRVRGLMTAAGERAFAARSDANTAIYSYERAGEGFSREQEATFRASRRAWEFWQTQPPSYRRTATHWVVSAKRADTRQRRLEQLVTDSAAGRRLGHLDR